MTESRISPRRFDMMFEIRDLSQLASVLDDALRRVPQSFRADYLTCKPRVVRGRTVLWECYISAEELS